MNRNSYDISKYRLEKAKEDLNAATQNLANTHLAASINRSYYCIFHAMRAVLALDGFDSKKHSGVIAYFRQNYIKTNIFDKIYSEIIGMAFEIRNKNGNRSGYNIKSVRRGIWRYDMRYGDNNIINAFIDRKIVRDYSSITQGAYFL
ncbi:HEPN domain-containing protein [bacterium]|nr:HEPN domain-containing protein [bacterium]MBU1752828.1 HEPN domain-containing protein [bacterium]